MGTLWKLCSCNGLCFDWFVCVSRGIQSDGRNLWRLRGYLSQHRRGPGVCFPTGCRELQIMIMCSWFHYWDLLKMLGYNQIVGSEYAYDLPKNRGRSWILGGQE